MKPASISIPPWIQGCLVMLLLGAFAFAADENNNSTPANLTPTTNSSSGNQTVAVPQNFVAVISNKTTVTINLSWNKIDDPKASYQIYMAYGNHSKKSEFIHLRGTFDNEEYLKLHQLYSHVKGELKWYTFLEFKVRAAVGNHTSNFTAPATLNINMLSAHKITPHINTIQSPVSDIWKYVLPVLCVVLGVLLTVIGLYTYRQVQTKRRYRQYMRTHYETDTEAVSVSNDNYDEFGNDDHHLMFSDQRDRDDDHLVLA